MYKNKLIRTYYFIISQILDRYSTSKRQDKAKLHKLFKQWYADLHELKHTSLSQFSRIELTDFVNKILIEFSVEYGVYLLQPYDPDNAEDMSLSEYLEHKNWTMESYNDILIEGVKHLPEGFILVENLKGLKRLKTRIDNRYEQGLPTTTAHILFLYSPLEDLYYKKTLTRFTPLEKLGDYINKQLLYKKQK